MALGRGLKSLIPDNVQEKNSEKYVNVPVEKVIPNPYQPRRVFQEESLKELADSIREYGIIEPLVVRAEEGKYIVIAGERRLRAAREVGLKEVPVILEEFDDEQLLRIALIENIQREDLNVIELAKGYRQLIDEFDYTQDDLARIIGKNRTSLANILRLLNLPEEIQSMLLEDEISYGAARALLTLEDEQKQIEIAQMIAHKDMSVREVERLIKRVNTPKKKSRRKVDPFTADLEERLSQRMDANVQITNRKNKGKIEIRYYSLDHLNSILELMGIEQEQL